MVLLSGFSSWRGSRGRRRGDKGSVEAGAGVLHRNMRSPRRTEAPRLLSRNKDDICSQRKISDSFFNILYQMLWIKGFNDSELGFNVGFESRRYLPSSLLASGTRTVILTRDSDLEENEDLNYGDKVSRFHKWYINMFPNKKILKVLDMDQE
jgi:hypothetical protein